MLAMPASATPETNCRRDIVIRPSLARCNSTSASVFLI
jgi:hypothetical protein